MSSSHAHSHSLRAELEQLAQQLNTMPSIDELYVSNAGRMGNYYDVTIDAEKIPIQYQQLLQRTRTSISYIRPSNTVRIKAHVKY